MKNGKLKTSRIKVKSHKPTKTRGNAERFATREKHVRLPLGRFWRTYLHAPEVRVEASDVDVQPIVCVLSQTPLFVRHTENKINTTVDLVLSGPRKVVWDGEHGQQTRNEAPQAVELYQN